MVAMCSSLKAPPPSLLHSCSAVCVCVRVCAQCSHLPQVLRHVQVNLQEGALGGRGVGVDRPQPLQRHNLVERGVAGSVLDDVELRRGRSERGGRQDYRLRGALVPVALNIAREEERGRRK